MQAVLVIRQVIYKIFMYAVGINYTESINGLKRRALCKIGKYAHTLYNNNKVTLLVASGISVKYKI